MLLIRSPQPLLALAQPVLDPGETASESDQFRIKVCNHPNNALSGGGPKRCAHALGSLQVAVGIALITLSPGQRRDSAEQQGQGEGGNFFALHRRWCLHKIGNKRAAWPEGKTGRLAYYLTGTTPTALDSAGTPPGTPQGAQRPERLSE